jgi:chemotaxis protein methyltransferase CheR
MASAVGEGEVRCWSLGCAAGEEAYTLAILWKLAVSPRFPGLGLRIVATDVDPHAIERAWEGRYAASSVKDLPEEWRLQAFVPAEGGLVLKPEYRGMATFLQQDVRQETPAEIFHCILCRYLAFTYFEEGLQREILDRIQPHLAPGGALVLGRRESLPAALSGFEPWAPALGIHRKSPWG